MFLRFRKHNQNSFLEKNVYYITVFIEYAQVFHVSKPGLYPILHECWKFKISHSFIFLCLFSFEKNSTIFKTFYELPDEKIPKNCAGRSVKKLNPNNLLPEYVLCL